MILIRKLAAGETPAYCDHLLRLDPEDRRSRFCGTVAGRTIEERCARIDRRDTLLLGCFENGELRAAGELCLDGPTRPGGAELALSVDDAYQSRGLGTALLRRMLTLARNRAIREVRLFCLPDNTRMKALIRRMGGRLSTEEGEVVGTIELPWPDQISLLQEAVDTGASMVAGALTAGPPGPWAAAAGGRWAAVMEPLTSPFGLRFPLSPLPFRFPAPPFLSPAA
jgi:GNAT superfamily N-acetyltransferase